MKQVAAVSGRKKSIVGAAAGALGGAVYKLTGDYLHDRSRAAWLQHRINNINSPPRVLEVRKPQFPPRNGETVGLIPAKSYRPKESGATASEPVQANNTASAASAGPAGQWWQPRRSSGNTVESGGDNAKSEA